MSGGRARFDQVDVTDVAHAAIWAIGTAALFALGRALRVVDDQLADLSTDTDD